MTVTFPDAAIDASVPTDAGQAEDASLPACVVTPCDPRVALPCGAESTNACRLAIDGPVCTGVVGTVALGGDCAAAGDCATGLDCFAAVGGRGVCAMPCCAGDDSMCGLGGHCATTTPLIDGTTTVWGRCSPPRPCDPLQRDAICDPGEGCYIVSSRGETDCLAAGTVEIGGACDDGNTCLPGLFCAGLTARTCVRICALGDGGAGVCPSAEGTCRAYPYSPTGTGICSAS